MAARALNLQPGQYGLGQPLADALMQSVQAYGAQSQQHLDRGGELAWAQLMSNRSRQHRLQREELERQASERRAAIWQALLGAGGQIAGAASRGE